MQPSACHARSVRTRVVRGSFRSPRPPNVSLTFPSPHPHPRKLQAHPEVPHRPPPRRCLQGPRLRARRCGRRGPPMITQSLCMMTSGVATGASRTPSSNVPGASPRTGSLMRYTVTSAPSTCVAGSVWEVQRSRVLFFRSGGNRWYPRRPRSGLPAGGLGTHLTHALGDHVREGHETPAATVVDHGNLRTGWDAGS